MADITMKDAIDEILRCDYEYCEDIMELYMDSLLIYLETRDPDAYRNMDNCIRGLEDHAVCSSIFERTITKYEDTMDKLINNHRQLLDPKALQGYDGKKYNSPFWFEGAGDVWRKMTHQMHNNPQVSLETCKTLRRNVHQCLDDPQYPTEVCFRQYGHALICEAGLNCPQIRLPLMKCLQEQHGVDFNAIRDCVQNVPNYSPCLRSYVSPTDNI